MFALRILLPVFTLVALLISPVQAASPVKVRLETNVGNIVLELNPDKAPKTVENFLKYVDSGFYNGTIFHRVINDFMIQGGGFTDQYVSKPTQLPIMNEAENGLKNLRGTIAMARTFDPHSATAQFFINVKDNDFLDHTDNTPRGWGYCVFGKVVQGMDVVDTIKQVPTGAGGPFRSDAPTKLIIIKQLVRVDAATAPAAAPTPVPAAPAAVNKKEN